MKKILKALTIISICLVMLLGTACANGKAIYDKETQKANDYEIFRTITVYNMTCGSVVLKIEGYFTVKEVYKGLLVVRKMGDDLYRTTFIKNVDNLTYYIEDNTVVKYE